MLSPLLCGAFNLSNTLGDGMVLQRTQAATVWARLCAYGRHHRHGAPRVAHVDSGGQSGGPGAAAEKLTATPTTRWICGSDGGTAQLRDVLFGDVGAAVQHAVPPSSMDGMNNMSAEIAAADNYPNIRDSSPSGCRPSAAARASATCTPPFRRAEHVRADADVQDRRVVSPRLGPRERELARRHAARRARRRLGVGHLLRRVLAARPRGARRHLEARAPIGLDHRRTGAARRCSTGSLLRRCATARRARRRAATYTTR